MGSTLNNGSVPDTASVAVKPEPLPKEGEGEPIHFLVARRLEERHRTASSLLVAKHIIERMDFGIKKYGHALKAWNGRNPLIDAYQELLDATVYMTQAFEEHDRAGGTGNKWNALKELVDNVLETTLAVADEVIVEEVLGLDG